MSSQTGFNHHLRYVLPAFPFAFVWVSRVARAAVAQPRSFGILVSAGLVGSVASSLAVYPHSMSYFHELAGGPMRGSEHLVDSNIDWGQDLFYLKRWLDEHPEARPLGLAYFGYFDPRAAGIAFTLPPRGRPEDETWGPRPGWYAVSVTLLRGYDFPIPDGTGSTRSVGESDYRYFLRFRPVDTAGDSIWMYHLRREDCDRVRAELGMPPLPQEAAPPRPGNDHRSG